ncbi:hypothetical protein HYT52_00245 [Candidatus Woesearchaeota archaeon]|nr:hypothetical protein [Candidatus Woesearchaeota archaeon]
METMRGGLLSKMQFTNQFFRVLFLFVLVFVLSAVTVLAESKIEVTPLKNQISPLEQAEFSVRISNQAEVTQRYSIYSLQSGQGWTVDPSPLKDRIIQIEPGTNYTTTIVVDPLEEFSPGIYYMYVTIESDYGERHNLALKVYLSPEKPLTYLPSFKIDVDMDELIDPREPVSIKLFLENRNPLDLSNLNVRMQSEIVGFDKEVSVNLPPLERKTIEFAVTPDPFQQPKEYLLFFVFERDGQTVKVVEQKVEIETILSPFTLTLNPTSEKLKKTTVVQVRNDGNVLNTQKVHVPVSFIASLVTDAEIEKVEGVRSAVWELTLDPNESTEVVMVTNYQILLYIAIFVLVFLGFYLYVRSPVGVYKKAVTTKTEGDSLSEVKITLEVKNTSKRPLHDIIVTDVIPGITNLENSLDLGTLKPHQIKHTAHGTKIIWNLAEVEGHEHRLITYKVKAKLNILGELLLPRAKVEFKTGRRRRKAYSNVYRLG